MDGAVKEVIDEMSANADEFGGEFLAIGVGIEFTGGAEKFGIGDEAAFGGGELEGFPIGVVLGVREVFV